MNETIISYNLYNDAMYCVNSFYGYSTPLDSAIQFVNNVIDNNIRYSYLQKEYLKALVSFAKYV